ncbi:MAG TPA: hypothetical protein VEY33_05345, partial [Gemmatimonadota bacterium]|nr:hypothetical protein [Gemmatimonadota bacterium]
MSGAVGEETIVEAMRQGTDDYLMKDELRHLPGAVERAIQANEERRGRKLAEETAVVAIDNAQMLAELTRSNTELRMAYETTLEGWSRALDLRDSDTQGHTARVAALTVHL